MKDTIYRQDAIDELAKFVPYAICDESTESYTNGLTDAYNLILQLPSAQPEHSGGLYVDGYNDGYRDGWKEGREALRQEAIKAVDDLPNCYNGFSDTYDKAYIIGVLEELPSVQPDLVTWLLDTVWDEEMWELNQQAFPELLCRKLEKLGYVKRKGDEYERLDQQTGCD